MIRYELRFNDDQIKKALNASWKRHIRQTINDNLRSLESAIKERYAVNVRKTRTYINLSRDNTTFRTEIGVPSSSSVLTTIINTLLDNVEVRMGRVENDNLDYMIPLNIILWNDKILKAVLNSPGASYFSESLRAGTIHEVPWLEWLLLRGTEPVVFGYRVMYDKSAWSRTDNAIMVKSTSGDKYPKDFSVREDLSGTKDDNFITEAAVNLSEELPEIIQKEIVRKL